MWTVVYTELLPSIKFADAFILRKFTLKNLGIGSDHVFCFLSNGFLKVLDTNRERERER